MFAKTFTTLYSNYAGTQSTGSVYDPARSGEMSYVHIFFIGLQKMSLSHAKYADRVSLLRRLFRWFVQRLQYVKAILNGCNMSKRY